MNKKLVWIVNGDWAYTQMFEKRGWEVAIPKNALGLPLSTPPDLVQFTGGEDVTPWLYGEPAHRTTYYSYGRDIREIEVFGWALERGIPMAGICRGGQFLNVMCGGKMWQDVDGHAIGGTHPVMDIETQETFFATSTHHQMMRPGRSSKIVAIAAPKLSTHKSAAGHRIEGKHIGSDIEVLYYPEQHVLCFQPHPEFNGHQELKDWYFKYIEQYLGIPDSLATHDQRMSQDVQNRISDPDHGYPDSEAQYLTRAEYAEDQF